MYTVRVVLDVLGAEDYGIYNVVAGVVSMFGFLSNAMATACQRYFSFELGRKDYEQLKKTFSVSISIYILIAIVVVILAETVGLWFVHNKLVIPQDRIQAARWIYQASIITFIFTILTIPFMAAIIAYEDMNIYAYVSIFEVVLKLGIVFLLPLFNVDTLLFYGLLMALVVLITTTVYRAVCYKKYDICRSKPQWNTVLFKELLSYTGWNMFGSTVGIFKFQAVNIVLNQFFTPIIITARGIASQVNSAVSSFAQNFSTAVRPQIIKSYAAGNISEMNQIIYRSSKGTFLLMFLFTLPLCLEMPFILRVWLKKPPDYTIIFTQLILIDALFDSISYSLKTAAQATGKIKLYQSVVAGFLLLNLPVSYFLLYIGLPAVSVFYLAIILTFFVSIIRLFILKKLFHFLIKNFIFEVIIPLCFTVIFSLVVPVMISIYFSESIYRFILITITSIISIIFYSLIFVFSKSERFILINIIKQKMGIN
ncbi:MAG: polysaccharide biosynthesis protein [Candidatus Thermoplasmatota archaeon]|nr:polysaccharide biosynthesis protein [Candidatus Thermoplasmatota archaeon]